MPLSAQNGSGQKYLSYEISDDVNIRQNWICPNCLGRMSFVDSLERIKHFRHLAASDGCSSEPDTVTHLELKKSVFDILTEKNNKCDFEVRIGKRIADLIAITPSNDKYAIECQVSLITRTEIESRNENYSRFGYQYIWFLSPEHYLNPAFTYMSQKGDEYIIFRLKSIERAYFNTSWLRYIVNNKVYIPHKLFFQSYRHKTLYFMSIKRYPELAEFLMSHQ